MKTNVVSGGFKLNRNIWTASDQDIFRKPVAGAREDGAKGLAVGCGTGIAGCRAVKQTSGDHLKSSCHLT